MQTYTDDQVRTMVNLILNEGWPQKKAAESVGIHVKSASYYVGQERKRRIDAARAAVLEPTLAITPPVEQHVEQAIAIPMPPPSEALRQTVAETVDHPPHYFRGGIEAIDVIEAWKLDFATGNALKYIARAGRKGDELEDLRKARWYIDRAIARREKVGALHEQARH